MTVLYLSAGHNPDSKGATWGKLNEYDEAVKWCAFICGYLKRHDHSNLTVVWVPTGSLTQKIKFINQQTTPGIAVELHFNSAGSTKVSGFETLYCPGSVKGKALADTFHGWFKQYNSSLKDRGVKEGWYQQDAPNRVDYVRDVEGDEKMLAFLEKTKFPALILEPHFLCELTEPNFNWLEQAEKTAMALWRLLYNYEN